MAAVQAISGGQGGSAATATGGTLSAMSSASRYRFSMSTLSNPLPPLSTPPTLAMRRQATKHNHTIPLINKFIRLAETGNERLRYFSLMYLTAEDRLKLGSLCSHLFNWIEYHTQRNFFCGMPFAGFGALVFCYSQDRLVVTRHISEKDKLIIRIRGFEPAYNQPSTTVQRITYVAAAEDQLHWTLIEASEIKNARCLEICACPGLMPRWIHQLCMSMRCLRVLSIDDLAPWCTLEDFVGCGSKFATHYYEFADNMQDEPTMKKRGQFQHVLVDLKMNLLRKGWTDPTTAPHSYLAQLINVLSRMAQHSGARCDTIVLQLELLWPHYRQFFTDKVGLSAAATDSLFSALARFVEAIYAVWQDGQVDFTRVPDDTSALASAHRIIGGWLSANLDARWFGNAGREVRVFSGLTDFRSIRHCDTHGYLIGCFFGDEPMDYRIDNMHNYCCACSLTSHLKAARRSGVKLGHECVMNVSEMDFFLNALALGRFVSPLRFGDVDIFGEPLLDGGDGESYLHGSSHLVEAAVPFLAAGTNAIGRAPKLCRLIHLDEGVQASPGATSFMFDPQLISDTSNAFFATSDLDRFKLHYFAVVYTVCCIEPTGDEIFAPRYGWEDYQKEQRREYIFRIRRYLKIASSTLRAMGVSDEHDHRKASLTALATGEERKYACAMLAIAEQADICLNREGIVIRDSQESDDGGWSDDDCDYDYDYD